MYSEFLSKISIILTEPSHPGNIGATARAMKNMGLTHLCLIAPKDFPSPEATARASGAEDLLVSAHLAETLPQAIANSQLVIATSARIRAMTLPILDPRTAALKITQSAANGQAVAVIFGRERTGLENSELDLCQYQMQIPTNPNFSSLNLAQAVQIICYEIYLASLNNLENYSAPRELPENYELEYFYAHLEKILIATQFLDPDKPRFLMRRLRLLYNRAELDRQELNILRGILTAIENKFKIVD